MAELKAQAELNSEDKEEMEEIKNTYAIKEDKENTVPAKAEIADDAPPDLEEVDIDVEREKMQRK